jgi:hypothetical protein
MRTKTLALSALLGLIGSASLVAQTNVYSLNAVGYINVTLYPGFNMITCPLIASPDNTIGTLFPNGNGGLGNPQSPNSNSIPGTSEVFVWDAQTASYTSDTATKNAYKTFGSYNGWNGGGTIAINPGQGAWFYNAGAAAITITFVGTVPQNGSTYMTNTLYPGFNMVSSAIPMSGDLVANTNTVLTTGAGNDEVFTWDPALNSGAGGYDPTYTYTKSSHSWGPGNPTTTNITEGFWYYVNNTAETWTENFSINP